MASSNNSAENGNRGRRQLPAVIDDSRRAVVDPSRAEYVGYHQPQREMGDEVQIHQLLGVLRRRSGLILAMALLGGLLAAVAALFVPSQYTARAQIVVEPQQAASAIPPTRGEGIDAETIDTLIAMLAARDHLHSVLASLKNDPSLASGAPRASDDSGSDHASSATAGKIGLMWSKMQNAASTTWAHMRDLAGRGPRLPSFDKFERTLQIDQERKSRVISVRYTSTSPGFAAAAVNRVIELYAKDQTAKIAAEGQAELAALNARMSELEQTMAATEARVRKQLTQPGADLSDAYLKHLEREVIDNTQNYERLANRQKQLRTELEARTPAFKVLYLATPPTLPSSLDSKYLVLSAVILAMLGGGVMAVIRESFDRTLRSEKQVYGNLGILCAGLVPRVGWLQGRRPHEYLLKKPYSPYSEAIRAIGAALQFTTNKGKRPQIVQITSSVRDEGKTTLATSLAVHATKICPRVLLIDLDFRQPSIGAAFAIKADRNILDYMVDDAPLEGSVHHVPSLGLDVLPMTVCPIDPVTLFSNGEMERFLDRVRKQYDLIIVDSPPLLGVTEATLLAALSDLVLVAVKWGSTRVDVAQNAVGGLRSVGWTRDDMISRVMAVVTQVELKRHASYRYGDSAETLVKYRSRYQPAHQLGPAAFQQDK